MALTSYSRAPPWLDTNVLLHSPIRSIPTPHGEEPGVSRQELAYDQKRYVAGALDITTGTTQHGGWSGKTPGLFVDLLATRDRASSAPAFSCLAGMLANAKIPYAGAVAKWLAAHSRFELRYLPTSGSQAKPSERAFGDVPEKGTRNHTRKRRWPVGHAGEQPLPVNGPWPYVLSKLYYTPEVTAAVQALMATETAQQDIAQLAA